MDDIGENNVKNPKRKESKKSYFKKNSIKHSNSTIKSRTRPLCSSESKDNWNLYFPENVCQGDLFVMPKLKVVEQYFFKFDEKVLIDVYKNRYFHIDVSYITKNEIFISSWPDFTKDLEYTPNLVIGLFGFVMEQIIRQRGIPSIIENHEEEIEETISNKKLMPRFIGLHNFLRFQSLKSYNYGKFGTVKGIVVRASDVKPFCLEMAFSCIKCHEMQISIQEKGCYTPPNRCIASGCYSTSFKPLLNSLYTQTVPWKNVRLQELNMDQTEGGRVPRSIECELTRDLTYLCIPGDVVIISGIIDVNNVNDKKTTASKDACTYALYMNVNSVTCIKGKNWSEIGEDSLHFKPEDLNAIKNIHSEQNLFRLVVASLSPNIYGHELVKAGLILALFAGGSAMQDDSRNGKISTRKNSHVLIVGDPGLGKSQMLLASSRLSPRGVYVCGNSTTASGLTVTVTKEGGGENSLEAGALVLADQGHCCIDEFDKMAQQHSALLEAMEQQTISMAKSGVVCTLPARTSIIAAANPSGGHYSKSKTVSENLKINGALLSRFDLVFILQDRPDLAFDDKMSEHVMALHTEKPNCSSTTSTHYFEKPPSLSDSLSNSYNLLKRLQIKSHENLNYIPYQMLQKYISYARKFSQPKLTPEVCEILSHFYLEMRRQHNVSYSTPITTRQLESLIRLTKARARVELRALCTTDDAEDVIEIVKYSMCDTFSDEFGNIDIDRAIHGSGMSNRSQAKRLINALTKAAAVKADDCFTTSEIKDIAKSCKIPVESFQSLLESLNDQGFLLKKGFQLYKIQTI